MKYKVHINVTNERGDELVEKTIKINHLDSIPDLDMSAVYAEAIQNELTDGPVEYDETDN